MSIFSWHERTESLIATSEIQNWILSNVPYEYVADALRFSLIHLGLFQRAIVPMVLDAISFMTCTKLEQRATAAAMPMISPCDDIPICVLIHLHRNRRAGKQEWSNGIRINFTLFSSSNRNRINSDYTTSTSSSSSSSQSKTTANATAFPFSFEELSEALLSYETDEIFSPQYPQAPQQVQQQQQQHRQEDFYPSRLSAMTDSLTYRAFSSSSSSNSSLAPQYIWDRCQRFSFCFQSPSVRFSRALLYINYTYTCTSLLAAFSLFFPTFSFIQHYTRCSFASQIQLETCLIERVTARYFVSPPSCTRAEWIRVCDDVRMKIIADLSARMIDERRWRESNECTNQRANTSKAEDKRRWIQMNRYVG